MIFWGEYVQYVFFWPTLWDQIGIINAAFSFLGYVGNSLYKEKQRGSLKVCTVEAPWAPQTLVKYFSTGIAAALKTPSIQAALLLLIIPMTIDAISLIKGISAPIQSYVCIFQYILSPSFFFPPKSILIMGCFIFLCMDLDVIWFLAYIYTQVFSCPLLCLLYSDPLVGYEWNLHMSSAHVNLTASLHRMHGISWTKTKLA